MGTRSFLVCCPRPAAPLRHGRVSPKEDYKTDSAISENGQSQLPSIVDHGEKQKPGGKDRRQGSQQHSGEPCFSRSTRHKRAKRTHFDTSWATCPFCFGQTFNILIFVLISIDWLSSACICHFPANMIVSPARDVDFDCLSISLKTSTIYPRLLVRPGAKLVILRHSETKVFHELLFQ